MLFSSTGRCGLQCCCCCLHQALLHPGSCSPQVLVCLRVPGRPAKACGDSHDRPLLHDADRGAAPEAWWSPCWSSRHRKDRDHQGKPPASCGTRLMLVSRLTTHNRSGACSAPPTLPCRTWPRPLASTVWCSTVERTWTSSSWANSLQVGPGPRTSACGPEFAC